MDLKKIVMKSLAIGSLLTLTTPIIADNQSLPQKINPAMLIKTEVETPVLDSDADGILFLSYDLNGDGIPDIRFGYYFKVYKKTIFGTWKKDKNFADTKFFCYDIDLNQDGHFYVNKDDKFDDKDERFYVDQDKN